MPPVDCTLPVAYSYDANNLLYCIYQQVLLVVVGHFVYICKRNNHLKHMARRKSVNKTGISHISGVPTKDIWISYTCLNCGQVNYENIGEHIMRPDDAFEKCSWKCSKCGFVHSKDSDLPDKFKNWAPKLRKNDPATCKNFWRAFYTLATANPEYYWKQCLTCGRVLPSTSFAKHAGWSEIEKQQECKACKAAINSLLNPERTKEQLHESAVRRRLGDLLQPSSSFKSFSDIQDLFQRFGSKCFKTGKPLDINKRDEWDIDHILPAAYFYPLTKENAALLSKGANGSKRAQWPSQVYTNQELVELARITGADLTLLSSPVPIYNTNVDPNMAVKRYLGNVRSQGALNKRVKDIKKILTEAKLIDKLSDENKMLLGL